MNQQAEKQVSPLYFERLGPILRGRPYQAWVLVCAVLVLGLSVLAWVSGKAVFLRTSVPLAVGTALVPFAIRYGYQALTSWSQVMNRFMVGDDEKIASWYAEQTASLHKNLHYNLSGCFFVLWAILAYCAGGFFGGLSVFERVVLGSGIALAAFASGVGIYSLFQVGRILYRAGAFPVVVRPHPFGVLATGRMLTDCAVAGALVLFVITMSTTWKLDAGWPTVVLIAVPNLVVIIILFIVSQIPLHSRMMDYKRNLVFELEDHLAEIPRGTTAVDLKGKEELAFYEEQLRAALALPEWPFAWTSLVGVTASWIGSSILPVTLNALLNQAVGG